MVASAEDRVWVNAAGMVRYVSIDVLIDLVCLDLKSTVVAVNLLTRDAAVLKGKSNKLCKATFQT